MSSKIYSLYILRCSDGSLYTGITTDVVARLRQHESGTRGAKYVRGRLPFELVFQQAIGDRSTALKLEYRVKRFSHQKKKELIAGRLHLAGA